MGYCNIKTLIGVLISFQLVYLVVNVMNQEKGAFFSRTTTTQSPMITTAETVNETVEAFLYEYEAYCEQFLVRNRSETSFMSRILTYSKPLCPCIPSGLVGHMNISNQTDDSAPSVGELELQHPELMAGGKWTPSSCIHRQNVAVIIPYRDREEHLRALLNILHPMMQRQLLQYTIYVVEQAEPAVFNKASLMNAAFVIARSQADYDCYIFHDVDMLPEDDRNFYVCSLGPRHVGSHLSKWNYEVPYQGIFGGVTAFIREHFELVNGFSNQYYGWGGEDDDMYNRILAKNLSITRFSGSVARFSMILHKSDVGNPSSPYRNNAFKFRPKLYVFDGLNSLRYKLVSHERRPLYTWLYVKLPPHPVYFRGSYRALESAVGCPRHKVSIILLCHLMILFIQCKNL